MGRVLALLVPLAGVIWASVRAYGSILRRWRLRHSTWKPIALYQNGKCRVALTCPGQAQQAFTLRPKRISDPDFDDWLHEEMSLAHNAAAAQNSQREALTHGR